MHFDHRCGDGADGVVQCDRGVGIGAGVEHDPVARKACLVDLVDQFAFDVALVGGDFVLRKICPDLAEVSLKRGISVHVWFAPPQEV